MPVADTHSTNTGKIPLVSVVIPTRNRVQLLQRAVFSVLNQHQSHDPFDFEVIVVEQQSSDGTDEFLSSLADPRVRVIRVPPIGPGAARNLAVSQARGTWIAFVDDDDFWAPDKLRIQLSALLTQDGGWGCTGTYYLDDTEHVIGQRQPLRTGPLDDLYADLIEENVVTSTSTVMVRRQLFIDAGGFPTDVHFAEDWMLWIRLAKLSRAVPIADLLAGTRISFGSATANVDHLHAAFAAIDVLRGEAPTQRLARQRDANRSVALSTAYLRANRRWPAARWRWGAALTRRSPGDVARTVAIVAFGSRWTLKHGHGARPEIIDAPPWLSAPASSA